MKTIRTITVIIGIALLLVVLISGCEPEPVERQYLTVFGHRAIMQPGAAAELPILLRWVSSNQPVPGSRVDVLLGKSVDSAKTLFSGHTDSDGMVTARFGVPEDLKDPEQFLIVTTEQLFGEAAYSRPVYIGRTYKILISTDKPVYQPGQTLHLRVLALDSQSLQAAAGQKVQVRLQDPEGIYLVDETLTLSEWGIGRLDFDLDSQAAAGDYHITAAVGPVESSRTVEVKPYELPRFEVTLSTDQRYYDIEGTVSGRVEAAYFFGKPVAGGTVKILGFAGRDREKALSLEGVTDESGVFAFEFPMPDYFFEEVTHGSEDLELEVTVTDTADHAETISEEVLVTADPLRIEAIPESGFLHPGVENIVYLEVSESDGTPVQATLTVESEVLATAQTIETDAHGLATVRLTPEEIQDLALIVTAQAGDRQMTREINVGTVASRTSVLVRPDRAEYQVGDTVELEFLATGDVKTVYLDLVKERQTIDFRALDVSDGRATARVDLDGSLLGTLEIHAYAIGRGGTLARDRRLVLVNPAPAQLNVTADAETYQPGGTAHLTMEVSLDGEALPAALGVSIVDESVFSVGAQEPGFVRTYFLLQEELLERRYGIQGFPPFDGNAPPRREFEGIQRSANNALMGGLAQELARSGAVSAQVPASPQRTARDWLAPGFLVLPLLGLMFYGGGKRRRALLLALIAVSITGIVTVNCAAPAEAPVAEAPAAQKAVPAEGPAIQVPAGPARAPAEEAAAPRLRQFFPETLFWLPELPTDADGHVEIDVPIADSITTWRVSVVASAKDGTLGSATADLRVFQDFFIEPEVPDQLTQNDEIEVPVSIFNYLDEPQQITLGVQIDDWFRVSEGRPTQTLSLAPNEVTVARLPIAVLAPGRHELRFTAQGARMSDAVLRELVVVPDGRRVARQTRGTLARSAEVQIELPEEILPGSEQVRVSIYPDPASQIPLQLPDKFRKSTCLYADMRSTQPVALLIQYLKEIDQLTPAQQLRGERLLHKGYQRLLRYYNGDTGGFTGDCFLVFRPEADVIASAAALMALSDLNQVVYVDPAVIERTITFLSDQQQPDGSWRPGRYYWHGIVPGRDRLSPTAYVAWALGEAGLAQSQPSQRALDYLRDHIEEAQSMYSQALVLNALLVTDPDDRLGRDLIEALLERTPAKDGERLWISPGYYGLDTTALMALALLRSGRYLDETQETLLALNRHTGSAGHYYLSQPAKVYALRAFLLNARQQPAEGRAEITLALNQAEVANFTVTPENSQIVQGTKLTMAETPLEAGENQLRLRLRGERVVRYQVTSEYYVPWPAPTEAAERPAPLTLEVAYSDDEVDVGDVIVASATVVAQTREPTGQVILELGVPAAFSVVRGDWNQLENEDTIEDFQVGPGQITVRLDRLEPGEEVVLEYRLQAHLPGAVRVPTSRIYQAITPDDDVEAGSGQVLVTH